MLVCAIGTQGDYTLFLAYCGDFNAGCDRIADAHRCEKFERLTQVFVFKLSALDIAGEIKFLKT